MTLYNKNSEDPSVDNELMLRTLNSNNKEQQLQLMIQLGIYKDMLACVCCDMDMILRTTLNNVYGYEWRCPNKSCKKYKTNFSVRRGSVLENLKLPSQQYLKVLLHWSRGMQQRNILKNVMISKSCLENFRKLIINKIKKYFEENPIRLGGPGVIVQADEVMVSHTVKAHRGRSPRVQVWLLNIVDTSYTPSRGVSFLIPDKSISTMIPIIKTVVKFGSIIHTDQHATYNDIKKDPRYSHDSVCHKYHFVQPITLVHTQNVESYNNKIKKGIKMMNSLTEKGRELYLVEFVYLDLFKEESYTKILEILAIKTN